MGNYAKLQHALLFAAIALLISTGGAWAQVVTVCDPANSPTACSQQPCNSLGTTAIDADHATIIACLLVMPDLAATDCASGGGCIWQSNPGPPLVRVCFELVGAGGGGGSGDCCPNPGGNGAPGLINQFDAWLHKGAVSLGTGGGGPPALRVVRVLMQRIDVMAFLPMAAVGELALPLVAAEAAARPPSLWATACLP